MWEINELLGADQCSYKVDTVASAEYQALSGCSGVAVPVEPRGAGAGTECVHWSELCLGDEL